MFDKNFFEKNNVNVFSYSELYDIIDNEYYKLMCDLDEKDYGYFIEEIMKKDYVKIVFTNGDPDLYVSKKDYVNLILENQKPILIGDFNGNRDS